MAQQTKQSPSAMQAYTPGNLAEAWEMSQALSEGNLIGEAFRKSPANILATIMHGAALGLNPAQSLVAVHVIEGRPSLSADAMRGVCVSHPDVCEFFRCIETTAERATFSTQRVGDPPLDLSFTMQAAQQAGLSGRKNYQRYPAAMLRARAGAGLARLVYPDLLMGVYDTDEMDEMDEIAAPRPGHHGVPKVQADADIVVTQPPAASPHPVQEAEYVDAEEPPPHDAGPPPYDEPPPRDEGPPPQASPERQEPEPPAQQAPAGAPTVPQLVEMIMAEKTRHLGPDGKPVHPAWVISAIATAVGCEPVKCVSQRNLKLMVADHPQAAIDLGRRLFEAAVRAGGGPKAGATAGGSRAEARGGATDRPLPLRQEAPHPPSTPATFPFSPRG